MTFTESKANNTKIQRAEMKRSILLLWNSAMQPKMTTRLILMFPAFDNACKSFGGGGNKKINCKGWCEMTVTTVTKILKEICLSDWTWIISTNLLSRPVNTATLQRWASSVNKNKRRHYDSLSQMTYGCMELDSHVDTIVLVGKTITMHFTMEWSKLEWAILCHI